MNAKLAVCAVMLSLSLQAFAAEPTTQQLTENQAKGRALFNESCSYCHGERGHATTLLGKRLGAENAMLERRQNLNVELIRHVVRHGINSMPWYRRAELSDRELESIAAYLLRDHPGK
jgi:mono/diheme cytochrome c family protein